MSLFTRISLANRGLVALVAVVITAFGVLAVPNLKQQLLPSVELPAAFIVATYPGAAPEVVQAQVARPIEEGIRGVDGLEEVVSTSREGAATIQARFAFGTDLDDAVSQMQTAINRVESQLPPDVDPVVFAGSTDDLPAVVLAAAVPSELQALADRLADRVVPELEAIDGVRSVEVTGVRDKVVLITPDPAKLAATGIRPEAVRTALEANGVAIPAGALTDGVRSLPVQVGTRIANLDDLRGLFLPPAAPGAAPVRLGDIAAVELQHAPATSFTRTNGTESLGIAVTATPDGDPVRISHEIRDRLGELAVLASAELTVVFDQAPFVESSIEALSTEGLLGLVMAVLVILVFLLSVRSTLVTAVSIPLSVVIALLALWAGDYSLNLLTLGALTISVGRVVDDSIVVLENIKRHLSYGEPRQQAIFAAVREVAGAVTASTLVTVAVFAPMALVGGLVGELFTPFAVTVTVALLASLVVSLTVIPTLAYWFLRPAVGVDPAAVRAAAEERERRNPLQRGYLPVINFATRRRWLTVAIGLVVLLGTFGLATRLETNFLDDSGQDTLTMTQELPVGTSLAGVDAAARQVEAVLARTKGVVTYQVTAGAGQMPWSGRAGTNVATWSVSLDGDTDADRVEERLRAEFAKLEVSIGEISFGSGGAHGTPADQLEVIVQAADPQVLARATELARQAMADTPQVVDVSTSLAASAPRIDVTVDRAAAARAGLTEAQIGQRVAQAFRGAPLGRVMLDGEPLDVVLAGQAPPTGVADLRALPVGAVTLDDVADISEVAGPVQVTRINGERSATVTGKATGSDLGATTAELRKRLDAIDVPGARFTIGGVSAEQAEAFADLGLAVLAAILIVFLIMVATFRSVVQALILLVSVPFAATGAIGLLLATGTPLGVPALIGVLMLVGIVVTNAIVLLDLINQYRAQGMDVLPAVVEGSRRRLRPILMTAIATIFALLPMALGLTGEGGFISRSLAIVVIGGLFSSTLLTLVLVPTLYTMVEDAKLRLRRSFGATETAVAEPTQGEVDGRADGSDALLDASAPDAGADTDSGGAGVDGTDGRGSGDTGAVDDRPAPPSAALIAGTDQFEVLRLPRTRSSLSTERRPEE